MKTISTREELELAHQLMKLGDLWTLSVKDLGINPVKELSLPLNEYEELVEKIDNGNDYE